MIVTPGNPKDVAEAGSSHTAQITQVAPGRAASMVMKNCSEAEWVCPALGFDQGLDWGQPGSKPWPLHRWEIMLQYIEQFRIVPSIFKVSDPTIRHYCPSMLLVQTDAQGWPTANTSTDS